MTPLNRARIALANFRNFQISNTASKDPLFTLAVSQLEESLQAMAEDDERNELHTMRGNILPVTEDPDLYYKIQQEMNAFPHLFTEMEKMSYGIVTRAELGFIGEDPRLTGGVV